MFGWFVFLFVVGLFFEWLCRWSGGCVIILLYLCVYNWLCAVVFRVECFVFGSRCLR